MPVTDVVPTAFARLKKLVETPILKELLFKIIEVLNPDKETKSVFVNWWGDWENATNLPEESMGRTSI